MTNPVVIAVGLGPAGAELITTETARLLNGDHPIWLRTTRHPAAGGLEIAGSFDDLYESLDSFEDVYRTILERLVAEAESTGAIVYAVPGSPMVAERTVELLMADERVVVDVRPALSFAELAWRALSIDPMAEAVTIVDAHHFALDTAGRLGPFLVTQLHSATVLDDVRLVLDEAPPDVVTVLQGLGTPEELVFQVAWADLDASIRPDHLTTMWIPKLADPVAASFVRLDDLVRRLRSECPWDREQTHASLRAHLLEETYEVLEAIDGVTADPDQNYHELEEELGDLLFQVFIHARLAAEEGQFTVSDVADGIHDKLYERHPHVFGDADAAETMVGWELAKQAEKQRDSVMDGIPAALPALLHALKTQKRAAATGFTGRDLQWALADVAEELAEVTEDPSESELGDLLFAGVQVARMLNVDPEMALRAASLRFAQRFRIVERLAAEAGVALDQAVPAVLLDLWKSAKVLAADSLA